jgi:heme-degrading monooxygenase HmoA
MIASTPEPPYFAVVFTSLRSELEAAEYARAADEMEALARAQPGFLGVESARGADGGGITVSYWESEAAIAAWRASLEHRAAQAAGRERWYRDYSVRVCRVERAYRLQRD